MNRKLVHFIYSTFALVGAAATLIVSAETSVIRDTLFRECNLRYYSEITDDHVHRVSIYNSSEHAFEILLKETFNPDRSLSDFSFASVDPNLNLSFVDLLRTSAAQNSPSGLNGLLVTLDAHYDRPSLVIIDDAFTAARQKKMAFLGDIQPFAVHATRLLKCKGEPTPPGCQEEAELERWERNVRNLTYTADSTWRSFTGLQTDREGRFYPASGLALSGTIPPHRTEYLSFEFDPRQGTDATISLLVGERSATRVSNRADLARSTVWIAIRYYTLRTLTFGALAFLFVLMARFIARQSTKRLSRRELANAALAAPPRTNESVWSELYNRVRPYIVSDYRHSCQMFWKTADLSPFELFDHIRNRLIVDYAMNPVPFPDERRLEERLHGYIREIAALS